MPPDFPPISCVLPKKFQELARCFVNGLNLVLGSLVSSIQVHVRLDLSQRKAQVVFQGLAIDAGGIELLTAGRRECGLNDPINGFQIRPLKSVSGALRDDDGSVHPHQQICILWS